MKRKIITGLVILSAASVALFAMGPKCDKGRHGGHYQPIMGKMLQQLDLTDAQKASLETLRASQKEKYQALKGEKQEKRDLRTYFTDEGFDKAQFIENATNNAKERASLKAEYMEQLYTILDEHQKAAFLETLQERKNRQ